MINGCCIEMLGWDAPKAQAKTDAIYDTLTKIFVMAQQEKIPTYQAADRLAENMLGKSKPGNQAESALLLLRLFLDIQQLIDFRDYVAFRIFDQYLKLRFHFWLGVSRSADFRDLLFC